MKTSSFKKILLRKVEGDLKLTTLISSCTGEFLTNKIIESLEKMAAPGKNTGRNANSAITNFAQRLSNRDVEMMRDALGHHVSAHKAELKAGNRQAADAHLNKIIPLMHLMARTAAHSGGKLALDYVPLEPWETNYTGLERRPETGKLKEGTKGLRRRPSKTDRISNPRGVPDFRYLEMKPHPGHSDVNTSPHKETAYPFEEIQLGSPSAVDSKQAYLPISNIQATGTFKPHPFDDHPIHKLADLEQDKISNDTMNNFGSALDNWVNHDSSKKWGESIKNLYASNPESYKNRGKQKPSHHFEGMSILDHPKEVAEYISQNPTSSVESTKLKEPKSTSSILTDDHINDLPPELQNLGRQLLQGQTTSSRITPSQTAMSG